LKELEGYIAKFECCTCGGKWRRRWRDDPNCIDYGIGPQMCPSVRPQHRYDPAIHHYVNWTNFDEFVKRYSAGRAREAK
jgi:hypothetical protein